MFKKITALFLCLLLLMPLCASADDLSLGDVNNFLNTTAKVGPGSKANQIAVIPFSHIDGPKDEDLFYAFVPFKYVARNYIKYQVTFISCTCRSADVNVWSTAYVELTLPSSGKIGDSAIRTLSFDADSTGHYLGGFWGDSNPPPTAPNANYDLVKAEMIPYYIGKTYDQLKDKSTIDDFADYAEGEGRAAMTVDAVTGATVSSNNILRIVQALYAYHATDSFFDGDADALELRKVFETSQEQAAAAEEQRELRECIARLPEEQREALVMTQLEGIPYGEAAERLGTTEGTVKSRVNRAKSKLKEWLAENGELSPGNSVQRDEKKKRGGNRP